ncbi:MAG: hypothetical protein IJL09_06325, partial [Lachnospiraceae bacterium]|nr:hypothetical protein [Lachnospiraceae bacterium]
SGFACSKPLFTSQACNFRSSRLLQTSFHFSGKQFSLLLLAWNPFCILKHVVSLAPNPFSLLRQAVSALFACSKPLFTSQANIFCSFRLPETPFHFSGKRFLPLLLA